MRTRVSMVIAVAVVVSFAAVANAQPGRGRGTPGGGGFRISKMQLLSLEAIQKELEMTKEQIEKIAKLREELGGNRFGGRGNTRGRGQGTEGRRPQGGDREERRRPTRPSREDEPKADDESRLEFQPGEYFVQDDQPRRRFQDLSEEEREERLAEFRKQQEERQTKEKDGIAKILLRHQLERLNEISLQLAGTGALRDPEVIKELNITKKQQEEMQEVQEKAGGKFRELFQSGDRENMREKFTELRKEIEKDVLGCLKSSQKKEFEKMKGEPFELDRAALFGGGRTRGGQGGNRPEGGGRPQGGRPAPDAPDA
jgi:hypothetical protein